MLQKNFKFKIDMISSIEKLRLSLKFKTIEVVLFLSRSSTSDVFEFVRWDDNFINKKIDFAKRSSLMQKKNFINFVCIRKGNELDAKLK